MHGMMRRSRGGRPTTSSEQTWRLSVSSGNGEVARTARRQGYEDVHRHLMCQKDSGCGQYYVQRCAGAVLQHLASLLDEQKGTACPQRF